MAERPVRRENLPPIRHRGASRPATRRWHAGRADPACRPTLREPVLTEKAGGAAVHETDEALVVALAAFAAGCNRGDRTHGGGTRAHRRRRERAGARLPDRNSIAGTRRLPGQSAPECSWSRFTTTSPTCGWRSTPRPRRSDQSLFAAQDSVRLARGRQRNRGKQPVCDYVRRGAEGWPDADRRARARASDGRRPGWAGRPPTDLS